MVTWRLLVGGVGPVGEVQMGFSGPVASGLVAGPTGGLWSTRCVVLLWRCVVVVICCGAPVVGRRVLVWIGSVFLICRQRLHQLSCDSNLRLGPEVKLMGVLVVQMVVWA